MTKLRRALWQLAAFVMAAPMAALAHAQLDHPLYLTGEGTAARLRGDANALPAGAARCVNCHEPARQPDGTVTALGPRLDARLAQRLPRRGGPPTAYALSDFCRLLRTGFDPAQILVQRAMPLYEIDDGVCAALWQAVLLREPLPPAAP